MILPSPNNITDPTPIKKEAALSGGPFFLQRTDVFLPASALRVVSVDTTSCDAVDTTCVLAVLG